MNRLHAYRKKAAKKASKKAAPKKAAKKQAFKKKAALKKVAKKAAPKTVAKRRIISSNFEIKYSDMKGVRMTVEDAHYLSGYILNVTFSNGEKRDVDFSPFINENKITYLGKYRKLSNFKKFKVEDGNVVWGKDWDLIFPVEHLYSGKVTV